MSSTAPERRRFNPNPLPNISRFIPTLFTQPVPAKIFLPLPLTSSAESTQLLSFSPGSDPGSASTFSGSESGPGRFPSFFQGGDKCEFSGSGAGGGEKSSSFSGSEFGSGGFPSRVRISGLKSGGISGGSGPAFVGQVFSMCDLSGTGLMAVSTHFDVPFLSKRTPEWLKKMFQAVRKSERNGPVFHFFMDLGDAVSYVKRLNIPSGVVGACRLDLAYEHFKEKPHLFQFVPNERQVKEANKLLKTIPQCSKTKRVEGVPVFSSRNLDIAIATTDGIKWYTPYFFDKSMLDNILEESVDQHFHSLIQTRHFHRRQDIIDDNVAAEVLEENAENVWEPPEVQDVLDEVGNIPAIPMSVVTKAAEIQLLFAVDKVLLGNRWLRKATGIQPKFPYMVDSFEKRSEASILRASKSSGIANSEVEGDSKQLQHFRPSEITSNDNVQDERPDFRLPFGDWFPNPWLKSQQQHLDLSDKRCSRDKLQRNPLLPKITMVGISTGEGGQMSKETLKKTMDELTKELEDTDQVTVAGSSSENTPDDRDPLFVANVGDYYSGMSKSGSARDSYFLCDGRGTAHEGLGYTASDSPDANDGRKRLELIAGGSNN